MILFDVIPFTASTIITNPLHVASNCQRKIRRLFCLIKKKTIEHKTKYQQNYNVFKRDFTKSQIVNIPFLLFQLIILVYNSLLHKNIFSAPPVFLNKITFASKCINPMVRSMGMWYFGISKREFLLHSSQSNMSISECLKMVQYMCGRVHPK